MSIGSFFRSLLISVPIGSMLACAAPGADDSLGFPDFNDYVEQKSDTGYVGNRAYELEATFAGKVQVLVPGKTAAELQTIATQLKANPQDWSLSNITEQVTEQIKYARNQLKAEKLNLNLEGGDSVFSNVSVIEGGLEIEYTLQIESLVKHKDLQTQGITPADLVGKTVQATLPLNPTDLLARVGGACSTDPETGKDVPAADLRADNFFFYWNPKKAGCPLTAAQLATATYRVQSSYDAAVVYPEFDKLVADRRIDMTVIFGQIEHGELKSHDWGFIGFEDVSSAWKRQGFRVAERFPGNRGHRLEKRFSSGLIVSIIMYTPVDFADNVDREISNAKFKDAVKNSEILYYNGHAFYGSLTVLDDKAAYPTDKYQILFMDACWSYAYYTKQVFTNRATEADPTGHSLVDVVNNTEPGITGSEHTALILWKNIFDGADAVLGRRAAKNYSWNNLVKYMNDHAERRARQRSTHPDPEIYGVSGVRSNRFAPAR